MSGMGSPVDREQWNDELDLRSLLAAIFKRKFLIAGVVLVAVVATYLVSSYFLPTVYQSEVVLQLPSSQTDLTVDALVAVAKSPAVMRRVAEEFPGSSYGMNVRGAYDVAFDSRTRLMRTNAQAETAAEAHALLDTWTNVFIASVVESSAQLMDEGLGASEAQLAKRRANLDQARSALRSFDAAHSLELIASQLAALEAELLKYQASIRTLSLESIPNDEARLEYLHGELAAQPRTLDIEGLPGVVVGMSLSDGGSVVSSSSVMNPAYLQIQESIISISERHATNKALLERLQGHAAQAPVQIATLREELSSLRANREALEADVLTAQVLYQNAESEYSKWVQRVASSESVSPRVVSEPTLPRVPIAPRKLFNAAVAGFVSLFVGIGWSLVVEVWRGPQQRQNRANVRPSAGV